MRVCSMSYLHRLSITVLIRLLRAPLSRATLLHIAAMHGKLDCLSLLMDKGIDNLARDVENRSALQLACMSCDLPTVQLLIEHGGWTGDLKFECAFYAALGGKHDILQFLVQNYSVDLQGKTADEFTLLDAAAAWHRLDCLGYLLSLDVPCKSGISLVCSDPKELHSALQVPTLERSRAFANSTQVGALLLHYGEKLRNYTLHTPWSHALQAYTHRIENANYRRRKLLQSQYMSQTRAVITDMQSSNATVKSAAVTVLLQLIHAETGVT